MADAALGKKLNVEGNALFDRGQLSTERASINSAMAYTAITIAASGHWPIRKAPGDGYGHQRLDVEATVAQRAQPLLVGVQAGQRDSTQRECHPDTLEGCSA